MAIKTVNFQKKKKKKKKKNCIKLNYTTRYQKNEMNK